MELSVCASRLGKGEPDLKPWIHRRASIQPSRRTTRRRVESRSALAYSCPWPAQILARNVGGGFRIIQFQLPHPKGYFDPDWKESRQLNFVGSFNQTENIIYLKDVVRYLSNMRLEIDFQLG